MATSDNKSPSALTYSWNIPSLSINQITLLCAGYINNVTIKYIPDEIRALCIAYYTLEHHQFHSMKHHTNNTLMISNLLSLDCVRFYIACYVTTQKQWMWNVLFPYLPKQLSSFQCNVSMSINVDSFPAITVASALKLNKTNDVKKVSVDRDFGAIESDHIFDDIKCMTNMPIVIKLTDIIMRDQHNQSIEHNPCMKITSKSWPTPGCFTWKIDSLSMLQSMQKSTKGYALGSPLFMCNGFKWFMELSYFTGYSSDLCLHLLSLPPKIQRLCVAVRIWFVECDITKYTTHKFDALHPKLWIFDFFTTEHIARLKHVITLKMEVFIMDIDIENDANIELPKDNNLVTLNSCYTWTPNDVLISKFKSASTGEYFRSEIFEISKFKFYFKFYPNGHHPVDTGSTHLFLRIASIPSNVASIAVYAQLMLEDSGGVFDVAAVYSHKSPSWGWKKNKLQTADMMLLKQFKFKVILRVIDVFDTQKNVITEQFIQQPSSEMIEMNLCRNYGRNKFLYWWIIEEETVEIIRNSTKGMNFISPMFEMFGLKWYLELIPLPDRDEESDMKQEYEFDATLYICLASSSPKMADITISYELQLLEMNILISNCVHLYDNYSSLVTGVRLKMKMKDMDRLSFKISMDFIDIYDVKGNNLTEQFMVDSEDHKEEYRIATNVDLNITERFVWETTEIMEQLQGAQPTEYFISEVFMMHGLKWIMKIYPNGSKKGREGKFNWYIYLISLPYNVSKIALAYEVMERITNTFDKDKTDISCEDTQYGWGQYKLTFDDIQKLEKLVFDLNITIIDMYDANGDIIKPIDMFYAPMISYPERKQYAMMDYKWNVDQEIVQKMKHCSVGSGFKSDYFVVMDKFLFFLQFFPNGRDEEEKDEAKLYIYLKSIPADVKSVSFYFEFYIQEADDIIVTYHNLAHFRDDYLSKSWIISYIKSSEAKKLDQLIFSVKLQIIDIFHTAQ